MKRVFLAILMLAVAYLPAGAADYLRIDDDSTFIGATFDLDFIVTRECPNPALIRGISNGWTLTASGSATWTFNSLTPDPVANGWFSDLTGLLYNNFINGTSPDSFLVGAAAIFQGMPIVTEQHFFTLKLNMGLGVGELCIDSAWIPPSGEWMWLDMTCGHGNGTRPDFLDDDLNTGSPFCITVWDTTGCPGPTITSVPVGDELVGSHCSTLSFDFDANPGSGMYITGWSLVSGPGTISSATGMYEVGPMTSGAYPVVIEVENNCAKIDDYAFNVIFTNNPPSFSFKGDPPGVIAAGLVYGWNFDATDPDFCDDLLYTTDSGTPPPTNAPTMDPATGMFQWQTDQSDAGMVYTFRIEVSDGQPDKATALYWLQVQVVGGATLCGDVDLSGDVDIDDVVYLVNYIFAGGPPPCQPY
jgi:hypothetical protein